MRLFAGDDWAGDHHDVELMDASGRRLGKARLPEGVAGIARLHAMIGEQLGEDADEQDAGQVAARDRDRPGPVGGRADHGRVYGVRDQPAASIPVPGTPRRAGARSDAGDAHVLADMVRTGSHQLRPVAGDTAQAAAIKVVTRTHQRLIWERTRHTQRLRHALRDYFPAALEAFEDLDAPAALELLGRAPDPAPAAKLTTAQISAALKRARRRGIAGKAGQIQAVLRASHLAQPDVVAAACAASVRALVAVLVTLNEQVKTLQGQAGAYFGQHPDAEIIGSQPGLGPILGARVPAESGDDPGRYASAKARKNYAGTSPITRASGKKKVVMARYVHNGRLIDALMAQAFAALQASPGARAHYDHQRARGAGHNAALRQLASRLAGIPARLP